MTDRDHFAAAALTGLLAAEDDGAFSEESYVRAAYRWADAMLRCRAGGDCPGQDNAPNHDAAPAARARTDADRGRTDKAGSRPGDGTGVTPAIDRLREWERHGSGRWGLGAAGDVTMLERRLAMVEAIVHDAAPAAKASEATASPERVRDRGDAGTGNTQKPVAWGVDDDRGLQYALHPTPGHASHMARTASVGLGQVVPLYRHPPVAESAITPTLTDEERQAIWTVAEAYAENDGDHECEKIARVMQQLWQRTK